MRRRRVVCRQIGTARRRAVLSFSMHREVLGLPAEEADPLLEWAEAEKPTIKEMRKRVKAAKHPPTEDWIGDQIERREIVEAGGTVLLNLKIDGVLQHWAEENGLFVRIDPRADRPQIYLGQPVHPQRRR